MKAIIQMEAINDAELVNEFKKGNKSAFKQLFQKHKDKVYRTCCFMLNNKEDAEDISQEAFVKAYQNINMLINEEKYEYWLVSIARNLCLDFLRRKKKVQFTALVNEENKEIEIEDKKALKAFNLSGENSMQELIKEMPEKFREVLLLKYINDYSYDKIAEVLSCPVGTVRSRLFFAKKIISEKMREN